MKKNRFAALLLTGKAATLPLLISQARADVVPSFQEVLGFTGLEFSPDLRVIELPLNAAVRLQSIALDSNYGPSSYAGMLCTNLLSTSNPNINFVVTGVTQGETVYIAAASGKNDPSNTSLDKRLTIGNQGLKLLGAIQTDRASLGSPARLSVNFTVSAADIQKLGSSGNVYVQAITIPSGAQLTPANWRYSELDEISVGTCATSPYGTTGY